MGMHACTRSYLADISISMETEWLSNHIALTHRKLPYMQSDHWSIWLSIVNIAWQPLSRKFSPA